MPTVAAFHASPNFHAHHSPMGAYFTFTCGNFGVRGGLAAQAGKPANQDIYVGVKTGDRYSKAPLRCLPFYQGADTNAPGATAAYLVEQAATAAATAAPAIAAYPAAQIKRHYGWGTDTWYTPDLKFQICTPFAAIPDPAAASASAMRHALLPAMIAELRIDNRDGKTPKTGVFAINFNEPGVRILDTGLPAGRVGFALRSHFGVAAELFDTSDPAGRYKPAADKPFVFLRWGADGVAEKDNPVHLLGGTPGIGFEVPPGKCYSLDIAIGCYLEGTQTTRLDGRYLYTRYFAGLLDVLDDALTRGYELYLAADTLDKQLATSGLSVDQQFLLAHATRSYYGSTELLDVGGQPFWLVNEGEYCMMNTLDLSVDHLFFELKQNPWVVRNLLDNFAAYYSYHDEVKDPQTGERHAGGLSFCHDMGIHNQFAPFGHSSYELAEIPGCFSHMTQEQLCNWILMAASYVAATGDTEWVRQNAEIIHACFDSMVNRDSPTGLADLTGVTNFDSTRCGEKGQEITTYDSLDESLAQARRNLYIAVKCWAAYLGLAQLFEHIPDNASEGASLCEGSSNALDAATKVARAVVEQVRPENFLPAVFEPLSPGYHSRILPAVEGLVYPLFWADCFDARDHRAATVHGWLAPEGLFKNLLAALRTHTVTLLADAERRNHFADGGIKLSSTSNNSWMSKIAIFQHVAREVFNLDETGRDRPAKAPAASGFAKSDSAHVLWQVHPQSAYWACSDQIVSGIAQASKYYPRIVTTILWMGSED